MNKTRRLTVIALLAAISFVLMIFPQFPLIPGASFLKIDFSFVPVLLGALMLDLKSGYAILLLPYDLMSEYDSLPHSYGENVLYQAEAHLIDRIALHPGVTVTDLANMVRKTPSACSQLVRRLRDKGWVEQVRNAANNRQVMLRLTPAGEHVYRDHAAFDKQCQALTFRRLEGFTEAELATYLSIQRRINEAYADDVRRSREYFT